MAGFVDRLLGHNVEQDVRKRVYMTTLLAGIILTVFAAGLNLLLGLNPSSYIVPFAS